MQWGEEGGSLHFNPPAAGAKRFHHIFARFLVLPSHVQTEIAKIPNRKLPLPRALWLVSPSGRFHDSAAQMEPSLAALGTRAVYCSRGCFSKSLTAL